MGPKRNWQHARAKIDGEPWCRNCGRNGYLDAAHILGRVFDEKVGSTRHVDQRDVIGLCRRCHFNYDAHRLDLWDKLTGEEQQRAIRVAGSSGAARRRISGRAALDVGD